MGRAQRCPSGYRGAERWASLRFAHPTDLVACGRIPEPWAPGAPLRPVLADQVAPVVQSAGVAKTSQGVQEFGDFGAGGAGEALGQVGGGDRCGAGGECRAQCLELIWQGLGPVRLGSGADRGGGARRQFRCNRAGAPRGTSARLSASAGPEEGWGILLIRSRWRSWSGQLRNRCRAWIIL